MATKRDFKLETPGDSATQELPEPVVAPIRAAPLIAAAAHAQAQASTDTQGTAELSNEAKENLLRRQIAETQGLIGHDSALSWGHLQTAAAVKEGYSASVEAEKDLPHSDEIDPSKIKTPVLSKQGWVLPLIDPRVALRPR